MSTTAEPQVLEFKAQTQQLLALMIHSLYTDKEIFLRELVSNASDALDRLKYEALIDPSLTADGEPLGIRLEADTDARTLTIHDNGIGMSRDEVVENIGTIARSGTQELLEQIKQGGREGLPELIGRFGVGFYSAFMVADRVTLVTRRAGAETATRWESAGDGHYTIADTTRDSRGTSITLSLKPVDAEAGVEDYGDQWVLSRIVKRYSDYISYPIVLKGARVEDFSAPPDAPPKEPAVEDKTLNSQRPVWAKPASEVTEDEYKSFYRQISHDWHEPMLRLAARAEGRFECQALVFIPTEASDDLYYHASPFGLQLYAKRVLVIEQCADLLPRHLRFVKGIVDVLDLPLNISRQMLQESRHVADIRKWLTRKVLDRLAELQKDEYDRYVDFWKQFGRALKEGLGVDYTNRDRLLSLFLFESSHDATALSTLDQYVERMKPEQKDIYYMTGDSREAVEQAPHVEAARERGFEVLYLIDPVDDLLVQSLPEHAGKRLKSLGKGNLEWESTDEDASAREALTQEFADLSKRLEELLTTHVKRVRLSSRLTTSPACLTGEEYDYTPRMERLLLKGKGGGPRQRRILELNPKHPIVLKLKDRLAAGTETPWDDYAELLLGYALLAEGSEPANPIRFTRALAEILQQSV